MQSNAVGKTLGFPASLGLFPAAAAPAGAQGGIQPLSKGRLPVVLTALGSLEEVPGLM